MNRRGGRRKSVRSKQRQKKRKSKRRRKGKSQRRRRYSKKECNKYLSNKIRIIMHENKYPHKQAIAIAYSYRRKRMPECTRFERR